MFLKAGLLQQVGGSSTEGGAAPQNLGRGEAQMQYDKYGLPLNQFGEVQVPIMQNPTTGEVAPVYMISGWRGGESIPAGWVQVGTRNLPHTPDYSEGSSGQIILSTLADQQEAREYYRSTFANTYPYYSKDPYAINTDLSGIAPPPLDTITDQLNDIEEQIYYTILAEQLRAKFKEQEEWELLDHYAAGIKKQKEAQAARRQQALQQLKDAGWTQESLEIFNWFLNATDEEVKALQDYGALSALNPQIPSVPEITPVPGRPTIFSPAKTNDPWIQQNTGIQLARS